MFISAIAIPFQQPAIIVEIVIAIIAEYVNHFIQIFKGKVGFSFKFSKFTLIFLAGLAPR